MSRLASTPEPKPSTHTKQLSSPGRPAADASLWSAIATMLATLDFNLAKDVDGNDIEFKPTFSHGIIEYVGSCSWFGAFSKRV